ncbi:uncharacterized protein At5g50100, chloroplastic-like isoform X2 [Carex rostrata]
MLNNHNSFLTILALVNMLKEKEKSFGEIKFVDISSKDYSPQENQGLEYETVMGRIHAIMSDGTIVTNVEAVNCCSRCDFKHLSFS